ncbi:MAG: hypothetical protein LBG93_04770 [Treponema sp.]|jgi:hypothetical protein|nr:hypothetical protein [Treponema sp.]
MTDIEKRKLFFKRWLKAFFSPFYIWKDGGNIENGVYDINDKSMRNVYSSLKITSVGYLIFLFGFIGIADNTEGIPEKMNHPLLLGTIFVPVYFILLWIQYTFFLAAFAIDNNDKIAKGEAIDNLQTKWLLQICFVVWVTIMGILWVRLL